MSIRLFCRNIPIGKDLGVMPTLAKNLSSFRKFISVQPQDHSNAASVSDNRLIIMQVSASPYEEIGSVKFIKGGENLEECDVSRVIKIIEQALKNKVEQANGENKVPSKPHKMSFDEFLTSDFIESYEQYKADPNVSILIGDEEEKLRDAYERYCITSYGSYVDSVEGSCPFTAL